MTTEILIADAPGSAEAAAKIIRSGGLVAIPTETVYGLGANGLDPEAVKKIFVAKGRPQDNPLILHLSCSDELPLYCRDIPDSAWALAKAFWPGPLTMVLPAKDIVPRETTSGLATVAVRCPACDITRQVIALSGVPIAAPSANTSGRPSPTSAAHVFEDMGGKIDAIIDAGPCSVGVESTIIDLTGETPRLLRPGGLPVEDIEALIGAVQYHKAIKGEVKDNEVVQAPGMKYRHYAPKAPVTVVTGNPKASADFIFSQLTENNGVICYEEYLPMFEGYAVQSLGSCFSPLQHAQRVFDALRSFDSTEVTAIFAQCPPDTGLDMAVANRLKKAAGFNIINIAEVKTSEMKVIGITGGTGCGKTSVLNYLESLGACVIDCDAVYHELLAHNTELTEKLDSAFPGVVTDGKLDRKALGAVVFSDEAALARLNEITRYFIDREVNLQMKAAEAEGRKYCAIDAIGLLEGDIKDRCDLTIGVIAPTEARVTRLMAREGISREYALLRINAQKPNEYFQSGCTYTLNNCYDSLEEFRLHCKALFDAIL